MSARLSLLELTDIEATIRAVLDRHRVEGTSPNDEPGAAACYCGAYWVESADGDADHAGHAESVARAVADALLARYGAAAFGAGR